MSKSEWIDWEDSDPCGPFSGLHREVEVKLRCGQTRQGGSNTFHWSWGSNDGWDIIAYRIVKQEPEYTHEVKEKSTGLKLIAGKGYASDVQNKALAKLKDTGNGYIFKIPAFTSTQQDNYLCMDYSEAEYVYELLKYKFEKESV